MLAGEETAKKVMWSEDVEDPAQEGFMTEVLDYSDLEAGDPFGAGEGKR